MASFAITHPGYEGLLGYDQKTGVDKLNAFLDTTFRQTTANAFGKDSMRSFFLMSDLPGRVKTLNTIVNNMIVNKMHAINIEVLPLIPTDDLEFRNTVIHYEQALLEHRPEQAPSRQLRESQTVNVGKMLRYGRGAFFTVDVANTNEGRVQISAKMLQFVLIAQKSFAMIALNTLLMGGNNRPGTGMAQLFSTRYAYLEHLRLEVENFCAGNKSMNGLMQITTLGAKHIEVKTGKVATHFILPPLKAGAVMQNNPMYTHQYLAGPDGPDRFTGALQSVITAHGIRLLEAPDYAAHVQLQQMSMQHRATLGRFEPIQWTQLQGTGQQMPHTYIFDINRSDYVSVPLDELFVNSGRFVADDAGKYKFNIVDLKTAMSGMDLTDQDTQPDPFLEYRNNKWRLFSWLFEDPSVDKELKQMKVEDMKAMGVNDWLTLEVKDPDGTVVNEAGEYKLFAGNCFRIHDSYMTDSGIMVRGGRELGMTGHSPDLIEMGKDVGTGTQQLEYSVFAGGFVADWDLVHNVDNIFYARILHGGGHKFLNKTSNQRLMRQNYKFSSPEDPCMYGILFPRLTKKHGRYVVTQSDTPNIVFLHGTSPFTGPGEVADETYPGSTFCKKYWKWDQVPITNHKRDSSPIATYLCPGSYKVASESGILTLFAGRSHHGPQEDYKSAEVRSKGYSVIQ